MMMDEISIDMSGIATPAEISAGEEWLDAVTLDAKGFPPHSPVFAVLAVRAALDAIHDSPNPVRLLECFEAVCQGYRDIIADAEPQVASREAH